MEIAKFTPHRGRNGIDNNTLMRGKAFIQKICQCQIGCAFRHFRSQTMRTKIRVRFGQRRHILQTGIMIQPVMLLNTKPHRTQIAARKFCLRGRQNGKTVFNNRPCANLVAKHQAVCTTVYQYQRIKLIPLAQILISAPQALYAQCFGKGVNNG